MAGTAEPSGRRERPTRSPRLRRRSTALLVWSLLALLAAACSNDHDATTPDTTTTSPGGAVTWRAADGEERQAVVELQHPEIVDEMLRFDYRPVDGPVSAAVGRPAADLPERMEHVTLFIDDAATSGDASLTVVIVNQTGLAADEVYVTVTKPITTS